MMTGGSPLPIIQPTGHTIQGVNHIRFMDLSTYSAQPAVGGRCLPVPAGQLRGRSRHARYDPVMGESAGDGPVFAGRRTVGYHSLSLRPV